MIVDLFSHKIHSSGNEWPDKLSEIAAIFGEFDGELFDREAFEERLLRISPRSSYLTGRGERTDTSKFRDEISAYPAYLGLYFLEQSSSGWVVRVSDTAKKFLLREEPDVASFLRLQLPLFQYPNAMGAAYRSFTNKLRIQANARDRVLGYIGQGIHLSPIRLIAVSLMADAALRGLDIHQASVTISEIFGLANTPETNRLALPRLDDVTTALGGVRSGDIPCPPKYESRFHTLRHTEMFLLESGAISLRPAMNTADADQLTHQLDAICSIDIQFDGFDDCTSGSDLKTVIASGAWGRYFDSVRVLPSHIVQTLTSDDALDASWPSEPVAAYGTSIIPAPRANSYPFRVRGRTPRKPPPYDRGREMADPELTRIKMQRRNLAHKELVDKMDELLRGLGAEPKENEHIDLFSQIPGDGFFIFEMKSGGEGILDQIRKGLSQLYEYRYRYRPTIGEEDIFLCLVLPENPTSLPWISDYLCEDREINLCWFDSVGTLKWPTACGDKMEVLSRHAP